MKMRSLGTSSLRLSELCLGTMIFGEKSERATDEETAVKMIDRFIDAGGNFIDTADVYASGKSEKILGKAIKGKRDDLIIATKLRFPMGDDPNMRGLSRKYIFKAVNASLERLDTDYIDILYFHGPTLDMQLEESLKAANDLITSGKVHYLGVSNFKAWQMMKALAISDYRGWSRFIAAQYQYSLVVRDIEREFSSLCSEENVGIIPWGPLGGGFLSGKYTPGNKPNSGRIATSPDHVEEAWERRNIERNWNTIEVMEELSKKYEKTYAQIAINWLLRQPAVTSPIIGVRTPEQLEDNLGSTGWQLSSDDVLKLSKASDFELGYPYRMIKAYCHD
jgi:aryl-alcohol dehydrogenase-like predicted oxidoreductase